MVKPHCGHYVSWVTCRLLLAVSMGSIYVYTRSGMPTTMNNTMASLPYMARSGCIRNVTANAQHPWFGASVNRRLLRMLAGGEIIISGIGFLFALHPRNIRPLSTTFLCLHTYRSVMFGFMFINLLKEM